MTELYEELPGDQVEEFYEDLPGSAYDGYPYPDQSPTSPPPLPSSLPPPLPSSLPPSSRPGRAAQPLIPQRAPSTTLSTSKTLPPARKKEKEPPKKAGTLKPSTSGGISGGGGGGGIDMNEILKKARMRNQSAFEDLESKRPKDDGEDKHTAPWLNQLRKTGPTPKPAPKPRPEEEETDVPPWVKRKAASEKPLPQEVTENGQDEKVPEFIKKARKMSYQEDDDSPSTKPSPPPIKPRLASPPSPHPKPVDQPEPADKPAWLKQRERQLNMSKLNRENTDSPDLPPKPQPNIAVTAPPRSGSPSQHPRSDSPSQPPPPPVKRTRPTPVPRTAPKPTDLPQPSQETRKEEEGSRVDKEEESPPLTPSSVRERAKTLERSFGGGGSATPPPAHSHHHQEPPKPPKPKVLPRSPSNQRVSPVQVGSTEKTPPPVPIRKENAETQPPAVPTRDHSIPPTVSPPPPLVPPRARDTPPMVHREPPVPAPSLLSKPPLPSKVPGPITQGEPTPPMVSVQKFRRRPLQSVDLCKPPPIPLRRTKPVLPTGSGPLAEEVDTEEIYDDTINLPTPKANGEQLEEDMDDVYDDVTLAPQQPLPPQNPPPPSRPPPPSSQPEGSVPPPVPSLPPPSKRPAPSPIPTEDEVIHYEMEDAPQQQNGIEISPIDEEQETYEDMNLEDLPTSLSSQAPSCSSLVPPSPASPLESPTLPRKQLTKDERRQQKEDEKREKEKEKERKRLEKERERLEKEKEKERKKREEAHLKNRQRGLKAYKQFGLPNDVQSLFAVQILLDHPKTKDHLGVTEAEVVFVLLISHPKLPDGRYLAEKEDGTIGYVKKDITQRTTYQSAKSVPQGLPPAGNYPDPDEDIYESLPDGAPQEEGFTAPLPPPNLPAGHPGSTGGARFPPPSQPPPPPPSAAVDGPEENYEYLPDINESG